MQTQLFDFVEVVWPEKEKKKGNILGPADSWDPMVVLNAFFKTFLVPGRVFDIEHNPLWLKAKLCSFSTLKLNFLNYFYDSLTCNGENGNPAIDTAGVTKDDIFLVACPALSCKNMTVQFLA